MSAKKLPLTFSEFKKIYSKVPRTCVEVVIVTEKGVVLTLRAKNGYEGKWHLPGGSVYYRETLRDAVARVAMEELGIEVEVERLLDVMEYFSEEAERGFGYSIGILFLCKPKSTHFQVNDQAERAQFFKKLPQKIVIEHKRFLSAHFKNLL